MHGAFFLIFFLKSFQIFFEVKGLLYWSKKKLKTYWAEKWMVSNPQTIKYINNERYYRDSE